MFLKLYFSNIRIQYRYQEFTILAQVHFISLLRLSNMNRNILTPKKNNIHLPYIKHLVIHLT